MPPSLPLSPSATRRMMGASSLSLPFCPMFRGAKKKERFDPGRKKERKRMMAREIDGWNGHSDRESFSTAIAARARGIIPLRKESLPHRRGWSLANTLPNSPISHFFSRLHSHLLSCRPWPRARAHLSFGRKLGKSAFASSLLRSLMQRGRQDGRHGDYLFCAPLPSSS